MTAPLRPMGTVHVIGAGPVGLFLTALLQSVDGQRVQLHEQRDGYGECAGRLIRGDVCLQRIDPAADDPSQLGIR